MSLALKVLCISPRFAPTNEADTHRLRLLLPHAIEAGWVPTIIAVDADCLDVKQDEHLLSGLPADLPVYRVKIAPHFMGLKSVFIRSWFAIDRQVRDLLSHEKFDVVFFSTNEFPLTWLAIAWKRDFGVPFCMDYQDPWVNDYYALSPHVTPPGGRFKYYLISRLHQFLEARVVPEAAGIMAVSEAYIDSLIRRYGPEIQKKHRLVKQFPAEPDEFKNVRNRVGFSDRKIWRYIGAAGPYMKKSASAFFEAWSLAGADEPEFLENFYLEIKGTSYAVNGVKSLEPLAKGLTIERNVTETPSRLPYAEVLEQLCNSDALIIFGSDDPAYAASKIYPYLLAGKPLLLIVHESSPVIELIKQVGGAVVVGFSENDHDLHERIYRSWFLNRAYKNSIPINKANFEAFTAKRQAKDVCEWLVDVSRYKKDMFLDKYHT